MVDRFLLRMHSGFRLTQESIAGMVKRAVGENVLSSDRITASYDNEVYAISTEEGGEYMLRINMYGNVSARNEAWAMERCANAGVPVPKVVFIGRIMAMGRLHGAMLQERMHGTPLDKAMKRMKRHELDGAMRQVGAILSKIHSIKAGGFYRRHESGRWDFPDWYRYMGSMIRGRGAERRYIKMAGFSNTEFGSMIGMLERYRTDFPVSQAVLNHGDLSPEHIFVDRKGKVTGMIDFGDFEGNTPIADFAWLSIWNPKIEPLLEKGYKDRLLFGKDFSERMLLHKLAIQMGQLAYSVKVKHKELVAPLTGGLRDTLELLED